MQLRMQPDSATLRAVGQTPARRYSRPSGPKGPSRGRGGLWGLSAKEAAGVRCSGHRHRNDELKNRA